MRRLSPFLVFALVAALAGCGGGGKVSNGTPSPAAAVTGTMTWPAGATTPRNATAVVSVNDLSKSKPPGIVLGTQTIPTSALRSGMSFVVPYPPGVIDPSHSYGVVARIMAGGTLWATNEATVPVITKGNPSNDLHVALVPVKR